MSFFIYHIANASVVALASPDSGMRLEELSVPHCISTGGIYLPNTNLTCWCGAIPVNIFEFKDCTPYLTYQLLGIGLLLSVLVMFILRWKKHRVIFR